MRARDGLPCAFDLYYAAGDSTRQALAYDFADQAAALGITITPKGASWDDIYLRQYADPVLWGWGSNSPVELFELTYSTGWGNYAQYMSDTVDANLEAAQAARTVEACADENANIIYGQIIDEELKDAVRITVIATGFKVGAAQSSMDFAPRKDLFASTEPAPQPVQQAPVTFSAPAPTSRFTDEDYIPDFLKRAR